MMPWPWNALDMLHMIVYVMQDMKAASAEASMPLVNKWGDQANNTLRFGLKII